MYSNVFGGAIAALILAGKNLNVTLWIVDECPAGTLRMDTLTTPIAQRRVSFAETPVGASTDQSLDTGRAQMDQTPPARTPTNQTPTAAASGATRPPLADRYGSVFVYH